MSTSPGRRRRGRARARHPRCGRLSGRSPRRGEKVPGPQGRPGPSRRARAARGSPPTPPRPHGRTTGLSRIPKGWRTAEIITFTTSVRDHAADPTTARSGRMGGCVMPPIEACATGMPTPSQVTGGHSGCHRPRGFLVSVGITGHQCESAHSGGEPTPPEPQGKADRAGEARTVSGGRGLLQGATGPGSPSTEEERTQPGISEGRKHPFPPHPPRQWEEPPERPRGEDPPGKGRSKGGKNRQGKQQAQGQMTGGSDKGHTESLGGASPTFPGKTEAQAKVDATSGVGVVKAVPHPAVRWEG